MLEHGNKQLQMSALTTCLLHVPVARVTRRESSGSIYTLIHIQFRAKALEHFHIHKEALISFLLCFRQGSLSIFSTFALLALTPHGGLLKK